MNQTVKRRFNEYEPLTGLGGITVRCEKCGKDMAPGYFSCIYCGEPFYPGEPSPGKKEKKRKILLIAAVVAILLLAVLILCVIFFRA